MNASVGNGLVVETNSLSRVTDLNSLSRVTDLPGVIVVASFQICLLLFERNGKLKNVVRTIQSWTTGPRFISSMLRPWLRGYYSFFVVGCWLPFELSWCSTGRSKQD